MKKKFLCWSNPKDALLTIVGILLIIGIVNVYSASFVTALGSGGKSFSFALKYGVIAFVSFFFIIIMSYGKSWHNHSLETFKKIGLMGEKLSIFFSYKNVLKHWFFLALVTIIMLFVVLYTGEVINGARRWIRIAGVINIQVSELAKLCGIIISSKILGISLRSKKQFDLRDKASWVIYLIPFLYAVIAGLLILKEPDMGTMAVLVGVVWVMYYNAGLDKKWFFGLVGFGGVLFALYCWIAPNSYHFRRIRAWIDPASNIETSYQAVQAANAIGSGGMFGALEISKIPFLDLLRNDTTLIDKIGFGTGKLYFLPEPHTDFAFAVYCQEWGFIGACFLMLLFILLCYSINAIAMKSRTEEAFLLVTGINFFIVGQAFANIFMVTGLLPVIGVPMPFLSYGGSSLLVILASVWLVVSVYNETEKFEERELLLEEEILKNREKLNSQTENRFSSKRANFKRWDI